MAVVGSVQRVAYASLQPSAFAERFVRPHTPVVLVSPAPTTGHADAQGKGKHAATSAASAFVSPQALEALAGITAWPAYTQWRPADGLLAAWNGASVAVPHVSVLMS